MNVANLVGRRSTTALLLPTRWTPNLISHSTSPPYSAIRRDKGSRSNSTIAPPTASTSQSADDTSSNPSRTSRSSYRGLFYGTISILIGLSAGYIVRYALLPPAPHLPNTKEDIALLALLNRDLNALPIVTELRSHPDKWIESPVYGKISEEENASKLTAGTMQGSRGLDVHTLFWNVKENRSISVIHFGGALAGWPGVTHGGAIATVLLENLERVASGMDPNHTEWASAFAEIMELQYRSPTFAQKFYVIRSEMDESAMSTIGSGVRAVKATLESADKGKICVEAKAWCKPGIPVATVLGSSPGETEPTGIFHSWYNAIQSVFS